MSEADLHAWATWAEIVLAGAAFVALVFVAAPYGRHGQAGWGPTMPNSAGWVVMELPAVLGFLAVYLAGRDRFAAAPLILAGLWLVHYVPRTFVFPFRIRTRGKRIAAAIVGMGFAFNCLNAYVVARWLSELGRYPASWPADPRFLTGALLFVAGFAVNQRADRMLIDLRRPGDTGYRVPEGWLYEYVACPNYLGEIVEWFGFALATWSLAGLAFALFTAANIGPRAVANLRWYRRSFPDYPPGRKALIPFLL